MGYFLQPAIAPARESRPAPVHNSSETAKTEVPEFFTVNSGRRFYSPELGRWLSRDPIGEGGGENRYAMCCNELTSTIDSDGQMPIIVPPALLEPPPVLVRPMPPRLRPMPRIGPGLRLPPPRVTPRPRLPRLGPYPPPEPIPQPSPLPVPGEGIAPWPEPPASPMPSPPTSGQDGGCERICYPYREGTLGWYGPHDKHSHYFKALGIYLRPHIHLMRVNRQRNWPHKCFWNDNDPDGTVPPPPPGAIDLNVKDNWNITSIDPNTMV